MRKSAERAGGVSGGAVSLVQPASPSDNWGAGRPASEHVWPKTCRVRVHHRRGWGRRRVYGGWDGRERCSDCGRVSAAAAAAATQQICLIAVLSRGVGVGAPTDEQ